MKNNLGFTGRLSARREGHSGDCLEPTTADLRRQLAATTEMLRHAAGYVLAAWRDGALHNSMPRGNTAAARMHKLCDKNDKMLGGQP